MNLAQSDNSTTEGSTYSYETSIKMERRHVNELVLVILNVHYIFTFFKKQIDVILDQLKV